MIPEFTDKRERIDWMIKNKSSLIAQKKSTIKHADACGGSLAISYITNKGEETDKEEMASGKTEISRIKVRSIINTTKLFDSHGDVHLDQLWNKSIKETSENYLVKEHDFSFNGIISDNVKVFAKQMTWAELNFNYPGYTQALVYDSFIEMPKRLLTANEIVKAEMFEMYLAKKVKQHSVGMRYVKFDFAVNDERYEAEFDLWNKYFDQIANKQDALDAGYFWPVTEAKNIEGSAVVKGSNYATPTLSVEEKSEPLGGTQAAAAKSTAIMKELELLNIKLKLK